MYIIHWGGFREAHSHLTKAHNHLNVCGHHLCWYFGRNQKRNVAVISITLRKACLSLPVIHETSNWLTSVFGVLVYQILHKLSRNVDITDRKIIYAFKQCLTTGDFHETRACWTTLIKNFIRIWELFICRHLGTNSTNRLTNGRTVWLVWSKLKTAFYFQKKPKYWRLTKVNFKF
jgi:hypothetical protein